MTPVYIDELLADCVAKASAKLLSALQAIDPVIQQIHFEHGHPLEIIDIMKSMSQAVVKKPMRYPLVALFRDFPERPKLGLFCSAKVQIFIMTRTLPTYYSNDRKEKNFKPILHPIADELLNQIAISGKFSIANPDQQYEEKIDHYFWGRESIYGATDNIFQDWIDCVEIKNLILEPYLKKC